MTEGSADTALSFAGKVLNAKLQPPRLCFDQSSHGLAKPSG
jgi:hypothetical protein